MSTQPPYPPPPSRPPSYRPGRRPFPIAAVVAAVVVLIIVAGVAYWLGGRGDDKPTATATTPPASAAPSDSTGPAPSATAAVAPAASASVAAATASAGGSPPSATPPPATSKAPSPTVTSPSPTGAVTTSPPVNPVPDFGYLHTVVSANGVTKITFDRAVLLSGPAAESYAKAHHTEVTDDYIIQNDNPLIRTWTVSPSVVVTGSIQLSGKVESTPSTLAALQAFMAAHPSNFLPVDLYYDKNDAVTKIAEVYFP